MKKRVSERFRREAKREIKRLREKEENNIAVISTFNHKRLAVLPADFDRHQQNQLNMMFRKAGWKGNTYMYRDGGSLPVTLSGTPAQIFPKLQKLLQDSAKF